MELVKSIGLDMTNIDNMAAGPFNNRSYYGYKGKILKSGICKYYRRKQFDKFEWCIIEMMLFGFKNKGLLTNVLNRLKILLMEEIVCYDIGDVINCISILNDLDKTKNDLDYKIIRVLEICSIIKNVRRGRIVSYVNCWWKLNSIKYDLNNVSINKIAKYKRPSDSEEILKYGELFIDYLENNDERIVDIFNKLYNKSGKYGSRYRRKDAVFILFEIIEDKYQSNKRFMIAFDFIKNMFFRKGMTERKAFGIWLMIIVWKYKEIDFNSKYSSVKINSLKDYFKSRVKIDINEKFVTEDYHIHKKFGLSSFGNEGSKVIDEDLSILGSNGNKYRQLYIDDKNGVVYKTKKNIKEFASQISKKSIKSGVQNFIKQTKKPKFKVKSNKVNKSPHKLKDKTGILLSVKHENKYLKGYVQKPAISYSKLDNAKQNAINLKNVGGITFSKKKHFTLRKGKDLKHSPSGESSWLKLDDSQPTNIKNKPKFKVKNPKSIEVKNKPKFKVKNPKSIEVKITNKHKTLLKYFNIKPMSNSEFISITNLPQGQKLTSTSKKSVYMGKTHVYKGPFTENDKKLQNNIKFTMALKILESVSGIKENMRSLLQFEIKERDNFYFIMYKNIGKSENMINTKTININTTLISKTLTEMAKTRGENTPSKQIKLFPRGVIKRISDIITMYPDKFTSDIKQATLQHLYFRYLLNIGDSGTQNILYREDNSKQLVVGIDMEEIRGKDQGKTQLEYLFNSKYNKKIALFRDSIDLVSTIDFTKLEKHKKSLINIGIDINDIKIKINKYNESNNLP